MYEELKELAGPFEIFELTDGQTYRLRVTGWELGKVMIHPADRPAGKLIRALRVRVPAEIKTDYPPYWDITSQRLVAQLLPYLQQPGYVSKEFVITKHGVAPKARFTLEVRPL